MRVSERVRGKERERERERETIEALEEVWLCVFERLRSDSNSASRDPVILKSVTKSSSKDSPSDIGSKILLMRTGLYSIFGKGRSSGQQPKEERKEKS